MACDVPCMSYMALYVISMHLVNSSSRSSTTSSQHWKLNLSAGKVEPADTTTSGNKQKESNIWDKPVKSFSLGSDGEALYDSTKHHQYQTDEPSSAVFQGVYEDRMMQIIHSQSSSAVSSPPDDRWIVVAPADNVIGTSGCVRCLHNNNDIKSEKGENNNLCSNKDTALNRPVHCTSDSINGATNNNINSKDRSSAAQSTKQEDDSNYSSYDKQSKHLKQLTCGRQVNSTIYDHLKGVSLRHLHTNIPEPDVAVVFQNSGTSSGEVDMNDLEKKLRRARSDVEKAGPSQRESAVDVYNLIGNFWRVKGHTQTAMECFRKALSISPEHPTVLINLARLLLTLQFYEDAMLLALKSLRLVQEQKQDESSKSYPHLGWLQHFTIGQSLKALAETESDSLNSIITSVNPSPHSIQRARLAASHFRQSVTLNPTFSPARVHLRELEALGFTGAEAPSKAAWTFKQNSEFFTKEDKSSADMLGFIGDYRNLPSTTQLVIFVGLSISAALLSGVLLSLEATLPSVRGERDENGESKFSHQRHFNRAMAMRSMKLGVNRRGVYARSRKS